MFNLKKNKANTSKQTQQNNRVKDQKEQSMQEIKTTTNMIYKLEILTP